jgi:hypothetical protein
MEMPSIKDYLIQIRSWVGKDTVIIVPNTDSYRVIVPALNDSNIKFKS